jgi:serine/threonine protein kinase
MLVDDGGYLIGIEADKVSESPHYLSPEVIRGRSAVFESRIYNLGAVCYFIATRREPFGSYSAGSPRDAHLELVLIEPQKFNNIISPELSALIRKMISPSSANRHKTVSSLKLDLANVRRGEWPLNAPISIDVHQEKPGDIFTNLAAAQKQSARNAKRIAVSNERISEVRRKQKSALRRSSNGFLYLVLLLLAFWAAWHFKLQEHIGNQAAFQRLIDKIPLELRAVFQRDDAPAADVPAKNSSPELEARRKAQEEQRRLEDKYRAQRDRYLSQQQARSDSSANNSSKSRTWRDRDFLAAARLYNAAIDRLDQYAATVQSGRPNPRMLDGIEDMLHSAIGHFKSCRSRAPANVDIDKYIDNCYKLIAKTRQSKLLDISGSSSRRHR